MVSDNGTSTPRGLVNPVAQQIAFEEWPNLRRQPVAPKGKGYLIVRQRIAEALEAGYSEQEIRIAVRRLTIWSQRAMEVALNRDAPSSIEAWRNTV